MGKANTLYIKYYLTYKQRYDSLFGNSKWGMTHSLWDGKCIMVYNTNTLSQNSNIGFVIYYGFFDSWSFVVSITRNSCNDVVKITADYNLFIDWYLDIYFISGYQYLMAVWYITLRKINHDGNEKSYTLYLMSFYWPLYQTYTIRIRITKKW